MGGYFLLASIFGVGAFFLFNVRGEHDKDEEYSPAVMGLIVFAIIFVAAMFTGGRESLF